VDPASAAALPAAPGASTAAAAAAAGDDGVDDVALEPLEASLLPVSIVVLVRWPAAAAAAVLLQLPCPAAVLQTSVSTER
jgi:hypothetical protein